MTTPAGPFLVLFPEQDDMLVGRHRSFCRPPLSLPPLRLVGSYAPPLLIKVRDTPPPPWTKFFLLVSPPHTDYSSGSGWQVEMGFHVATPAPVPCELRDAISTLIILLQPGMMMPTRQKNTPYKLAQVLPTAGAPCRFTCLPPPPGQSSIRIRTVLHIRRLFSSFILQDDRLPGKLRRKIFSSIALYVVPSPLFCEVIRDFL